MSLNSVALTEDGRVFAWGTTKVSHNNVALTEDERVFAWGTFR